MTVITGPRTSSAYTRDALDRAGDEEKQLCRDRVGEYLVKPPLHSKGGWFGPRAPRLEVAAR